MPNKTEILRAEAEELLSRTSLTKNLYLSDVELLHELQVHQIELEMQNDELRRNQNAMEESRDRYLDLYDFAPHSYLTLNQNGLIDEINLTTAVLLGVKRSKLLQRRFAAFVVKEDIDRWYQHFLNALNLDGTHSCELELRLKDGTRIATQMDCQRINKVGQTSGVRIIMTNITERKQAEVELRKSTENLLAILNNSPYMTWLKDTNGRYIKINKSYLEYLRQQGKELVIGKTDLDLWPSELAEKFRADDAEVMAKNQQQRRIEQQSFNGTNMHWVETFKSAIVGANGTVRGTTGFSRDITDRKLAEQQIQDLASHLQNIREEEKASIAREIHDELGGTINSIKLKIYQMMAELSEEESNALRLHEQVDSMLQMINEAAGITQNIITGLRPSILDDFGLLAAIEWQASQFHKVSGIEYLVNCIGDKGDLDKPHSIALFRILQEALTNVSKHSGASRVEIEYHHSEEEVLLIVSDNGRGLAEAGSGKPKGFGMLGMKERVKQLGGTIRFDASLDGGLCLMVNLQLPAPRRRPLRPASAIDRR